VAFTLIEGHLEIALYFRFGSFVRAGRVVLASGNKREGSMGYPAME